MNTLSRIALLFTLGLTFSGCTNPAEITTNSTGATAKDAIIGGTELTPMSPIAKSTVLLLSNDLHLGLCTATLISKQYAVTAAHCVEGARPEGLSLIFNTEYNPMSPSRTISRIQLMPSRNGRETETENSFDIALVKFEGGLPPGYLPALLLPEPFFAAFKPQIPVTLAGYGVTSLDGGNIDKLRSVEVRMVDPAFTPTEMLLDQRAGKGACKGDSGGPAYLYIQKKFYFWGVTSRGVDRTGKLVEDCGQYVVYTNAALFLPTLLSLIELPEPY